MSQPERLEHYELLKNEDGSVVELGHGAMGVTYKAFDTNLRCHVALKVISAAYLNDDTAEERFLREARGAAQLRHRNVASVFHLGRHGDSYFYAMEFIEGETVDERVKREGPVECTFALEIASQVAAALIAAHKQGLIHRDIKPSNLMLVHEDDGEMTVKLIDFGLVKSALIGSTAGALTSTGFVGTPYFASPEQLDQRTEDIRTDIYSLGVTLWFMLTGKPTFMGSVASVIAQHLDKVPAFESLAVLPSCVVAVLRKMLEKDVEQRMQSPQELRTELKRCIDILKLSTRQGAPAPIMMTEEEAFETIGLSSTHGLRPLPRVGSVLGERYRLIEDLTPEQPGRTFHAEDSQLKRRVRVKVVQCDAGAFAGVLEQVEKLQSAAHRNYTAVLAAEHVGAFGYVASEWLEGFPAVDVLRARRELTLRETLVLLEQIAPTVDAARELGLCLALDVRQVFLHFPEGFGQLDEQVMLRCPLAEWPTFLVKLDPLGDLEELEGSSSDCERTMVQRNEVCRQTTITQVGALIYDLLGGKPGSSGPLANVSEEGNLALRRALTKKEFFPSAKAFYDALSKSAASDLSTRPTQELTAVASAADTAPVVSGPRQTAPSQNTAPPSGKSRPKSTATPPRPAPGFFARYRWTLVGGAAALVVAVGVSIIAFGGDKPKPTVKTTTPVVQTPKTARVPPVPGKEWTNSLGMRYVPLGKIHFAATQTRVKDFQAFYEATKFDAEGGMYTLEGDGAKLRGDRSWKSPGFDQTPDHPVVGISYEDTDYFLKWLTNKEHAEGALKPGQYYRLPTDREWSEAAGLNERGNETPEEKSGRIRAFPWGSNPTIRPDSVNFAGAEMKAPGVNPKVPSDYGIIPNFADKFSRTNPVPGYGPNARGIFDLGGNVWEWCDDLYNKRSQWRVVRGGAWSTSKPEEFLLSYRKGLPPRFRQDDVGFRCVIATDSGDR